MPMKYRTLLFLATLVLLSGCLLKPYQPVPDATYRVEDRYAVVQKDSLLLILRPQSYTGDAQSISSNFFSFYIRVKNLATAPVSIDPDGFSLTAGGKQYDYVPLELVLGSVQTDFSPSLYEDPFNTATAEQRDQDLQRAREQYYELLNSYFSFGKILPGGSKEGFLFYNYRVGNNRSIGFDALGTRVLFER